VSIDDFDTWGYKEQNAPVAFRRTAHDYKEGYEGLGLDPAKELGDRGHGPNVAVAYLHDEDKETDKVDYKVSPTISHSNISMTRG
jgi:hypothetical protein